MSYLAADVAAFGSLLVGLATLIGVLDSRRRAKRLEAGQAEIATTVNGAATKEIDRSAQLAKTLADHGVPIPPRPVGGAPDG